MIRYTCLFAALLLCATQTAFSQSQQSPEENDINISISAKIIDSIELITMRSISFPKIRPDERMVYVNPVQNGNAGLMKATGQPNSMVRITFLEEDELVNVAASHKLKFNYEVSVNTRNEQSTSEIINRESRSQRMNQDGELYIWVGGNVNLSNAHPGNYQGEFTVEIEYI